MASFWTTRVCGWGFCRIAVGAIHESPLRFSNAKSLPLLHKILLYYRQTINPQSMKSTASMHYGIQKQFLIAMVILLLILLFVFVEPLLITLLFAGILVTAVYPIHKWIRSKIPLSESLAAFVSLILIAAVVIVPFTLLIFFISAEATAAYLSLSSKINVMIASGNFNSVPKIVEMLPFSESIKALMQSSPIKATNVLQTAGDLIGNLSSFLLSQSTNILKHLSVIVIHTIVFLIAMFFLLRDGDQFVKYIYNLVPLSADYRRELFKKLNNLSYGILYGLFGSALLQGFLLAIGYAFAGLHNPAFWGAVAALLSVVPYIGTTIVWLPAVIALAVSGHGITAFGLAAWCILIVGTSDNLIKPYLIGASSALHPLAILTVLLGGAFAFGIKGIIFGPFILTLALSFLHIYTLEYASVLEEKPSAPVRAASKKKA